MVFLLSHSVEQIMYAALFVAIAILGLAILIKTVFENGVVELRQPFIIIVVIFLAIYAGAVIFVSSRIDVFSKDKPQITGDQTSGNVYVVDEPLKEVDLSTGP